MRPNWNQYFMLLAKLISTRSTCNSRPTGAIIVKNNHILSTGYNGAVPNAPHCTEYPQTAQNQPYCRRREMGISDADKQLWCASNHAESNAIAQAARLGIAIEGGSIYATLAPCYTCMKLLATARIQEIYYEHSYESKDKKRDEFWKNAIEECGIKVYQQITINEDTLNYIMPFMTGITSKRILSATE